MPLTHRQQVLRALDLPSSTTLSVKELAEHTDLPEEALQEVYNRGIGAWRSNPESVRIKGSFEKNPNMAKYPRSARLSKEQWAMARVYSFVNKGKTFKTADADIAREYKLG
jgi:hypothetical protein